MAVDEAATKFAFQAEIKQLMHLMVHSLYSNREIFLRELISNASDANDKLRFESLASPGLLDDDADLRISVAVDSERGTLSVSDNGIGMSRDDVVANLGTIARSGTADFLGKLTGDAKRDSQLIGQFGVGFYSAFIVADEVEVVTRRADLAPAEGIRWRSDGHGEFTVEPAEVARRGTCVTLHLKSDAQTFLDTVVLRQLIRRYSDHIAFPVHLTAAGADADAPVNAAKALWTRPRSDITDDEYIEFYKHATHDFEAPLTWSHNKVEGKREYTSLLYVPARAPFDLWNRESPKGLKLYVQRVFITDEATQFLPLYLRFVRGIVDASDVALNVSREILQDDPHVAAIKAALTKRVIDLLEKLGRDEPERYATFWSQFGTVLKEGIAEDAANRERLAGLLRFNSTRSDDLAQDRSLAAYIADAPAEQSEIYYLIGESPAAARGSPHLEALRARGSEVLLLSDRIDEWVMQYLREFSGKTLTDVSKGVAGGPQDEATLEGTDTDTKERRQLLKRAKRVLRDAVDEVRWSKRLTESPACLVFGADDIGFQMRELLKAAGHDAPVTVPSLELNAGHPLVARLSAERDDARFEAIAKILFDQAMLLEGQSITDPSGFVKRINALLTDEVTEAS